MAADWLCVVAVWARPQGTVNKKNLTFRWLLDVQMDHLNYEVRYKGMDADEKASRKTAGLEARCILSTS